MLGWFTNRSKLLRDRSLLGRWRERHCEKFLKRKGFKKLARNFSCKTGEIDLVMTDMDGTIIFVEVKTRANESFEDVESAITPIKRRKLLKTGRYFLATYNIKERPFRFDVVSIVLGESGREQIRHYENAFVS